MKKIILETIERTYKNNGQHAEQTLAYTLTGEIRKHDTVPFDMDSDIPEFNMSVKSCRFTLVQGSLMTARDKEGQIAEYISRVHSTQVAYVTKDFSTAYVMSLVEFTEFATLFCSLTRDSMKNGGYTKVKARSESRAMISWFAERAEASGTNC